MVPSLDDMMPPPAPTLWAKMPWADAPLVAIRVLPVVIVTAPPLPVVSAAPENEPCTSAEKRAAPPGTPAYESYQRLLDEHERKKAQTNEGG